MDPLKEMFKNIEKIRQLLEIQVGYEIYGLMTATKEHTKYMKYWRKEDKDAKEIQEYLWEKYLKEENKENINPQQEETKEEVAIDIRPEHAG